MEKIKNIVLQGKHDKPILLDAFFKRNNQPKPIVIFCHGYKGFKDWGAWDLMAEALAKDTFFVKFNFSHNGGTVEQPIDFPDLEVFGNNNYTKELDDLESVIDWVFENEEFSNEINTDLVTLIGHSRGGGIVSIKAAEDSRVKKVITLGGVSNFSEQSSTVGDLEQWKKDGVKYVLNGRTKQQMPHYYQFYENYKANEKRLTIQRAVEKLKVPLCIIHGSGDTSIIMNEAEKLHSWSSNSELHIINEANHVFGAKHPWEDDILPTDLQKVVAVCKSFLGN
ncbi:alpha/beta hydrolase family protein [Tenacibaculum sp. MEBiC06402]|uniref:alpha/beta hydrolase family protein n=1 Tax=unclassified Tenacibaculum TaxID=2635139 RepID=UPI003B9C8871